MKARHTIGAALAVASLCASAAFADDDRLVECSSKPVAVSVKMYDSRSAISRAYTELTGQPGKKVQAFATYDPNTTVHTLHVLMISREKDLVRLSLLGHELLHANCGEWH